MSYREEMIRRFWDYKQQHFGDRPDLFESDTPSETRPPVFLKKAAHHNVLIPPDASPEVAKAVVEAIPLQERQRWFRSMSSSQAVAQSVFGNLKALGQLHLLHGLKCEDGSPAFDDWDPSSGTVELEHKVSHLGEPRPTSIDAFFHSPEYSIAVECKLTEQEVGSCSRPDLTEKDASYKQDYCDGTYRRQNGRSERCSLTQIGVLYWRYIPSVLNWNADEDFSPCPLNRTYQLVRNVLTVASGGDCAKGHALLVYDERNPAFSSGGDGGKSFEKVTETLRSKCLLRKVSWQALLKHLYAAGMQPVVRGSILDKYGF